MSEPLQRPAGYQGDMLLRLADVIAIAGISRTEIYRREKRGEFPKRIGLGCSTRWSAREVEAWVQARIAERDKGAEGRAAAGERLRKGREQRGADAPEGTC